jgi:hypothetical protein
MLADRLAAFAVFRLDHATYELKIDISRARPVTARERVSFTLVSPCKDA